jgi:hypothetical protein
MTYQLCRQKSISRHNSPVRGVGVLLLVALTFAQASVAVLRAAEPNQLTVEEIAEGWVSLFDGETLDGWQPTSDADWTAVDGEIRAGHGEQGFLMTEGEYADYELHVEFKAPAATNSGIFLRTPLEPTDPATDCIELNIAPRDNPFPTASLVGRNKLDATRRSREFQDAPTIDPWDGQWHAFDVSIHDDGMIISFDERRVGRVLLSKHPDGTPEITPLRGHIGLQFREGQVAFRSVRIKELPKPD